MAITAIIASLVVLLIPVIVQYMAPNNSQEEVIENIYFIIKNKIKFFFQWGKIFVLIGIICIISIIIFDLTAEVDPRPWTYKKSTSTHCLAKNFLTVDSLAPENTGKKLFIIDVESLEHKESKVSFEANNQENFVSTNFEKRFI